MKLQILSDLHTEFADFELPETDADVVILEGDIGVGPGGLEWITTQRSDKPFIYVPGNHEYYGYDLALMDTLRSVAPANIHVLDCDAVEIGGVRFAGSTLWTDFRLYGEGERYFSMQRAGQLLEDFSRIRHDGRPFTPEDSTRLHEKSRAWIGELLAVPFAGPTVVVTHHLPSTMSIASRYAGDPLNPAFASRLEELIENGRPNLWIHGHTHEPFDYQLYDTRVICNPRGYPKETTTGAFVPDLVVEI